MSLLIIKAGVLSSIQDNGRHGFSKWGVNVNGWMDGYAAQVANALVGNALIHAVIEAHFPGPEIVFEKECLISITGADFHPHINDQAVPLWKPIFVSGGAKLTFDKKRSGNRCYISISGGFELPKWLGSCSTNMKVAVGGFHGRALQHGDRLFFKEPVVQVRDITSGSISVLPWAVTHDRVYQDDDVIRFIHGPEWSWLDSSSQEDTLSSTFRVSGASDRMATTLVHEALRLKKESELVSSAVTFGTMQLLPSGQLIVLMADHQTTGGYPRIGNVITSDLPKFAQLDVGASFRFVRTPVAEAEKILISLQQQLRKISESCLYKLQ